MIIVMRSGASQEQIDTVIEKVHSFGLRTHPIFGVQKTVIGIIGDDKTRIVEKMQSMPGVEDIIPILQPYKFAGREAHPENTVIKLNGASIGGDQAVVIAGPCAVESEEQLMETAKAVKRLGASIVRGGAFKPRTSPFSFQGLEKKALKMLAKVKTDLGIPVITEVLDIQNIEVIARHADILQVGARNMQNFALLKELAKMRHPILLKRGFSATVTEWLTAADYLLAEGNQQVIMCERGIRTFEDSTRFSLDIGSISVIKRFSHLPVIVDPSHAAGHFAYVPSISRAAVAAGADGLLIEVHLNPEEALVDGLQSLNLPNFERLMAELRPIAKAVGRSI